MKVALVTGASSGIGRAVATKLAQSGFRTFGTTRSDADPIAGVEFVRVDVREPESVKRGVAAVRKEAGRIDILVNNAGGSMISAAEETSDDEARDLFEVNVFGAMRMTQAVLPSMRAQRSGRILNITSVLGFLPAPFMSMYAATKHALEGYSESLDHEVRKFGVRVIVIEPGFTKTNLGQHSVRVRRPLPEYSIDRDLVIARVGENVRNGDDPAIVAGIVVKAATASHPALHYQAGSGARLLRVLRSIAPAGIVDKGVRRQFGLGVAS